MSRALPFTEASLARAIKGVEKAGRFVIGVRVADGTLIVGDKPLETASFVPAEGQDAPASKWQDQLA
jgi:20S proteasome alpha/beta subunit